MINDTISKKTVTYIQTKFMQNIEYTEYIWYNRNLDLTQNEINKIKQLNAYWINLENDILKELKEIRKYTLDRVKKSNFLKDYEIEIELCFVMLKDEDEEIEIVKLTENGKRVSSFGFGDGENHNDLPKDHILSDIFMCWILHCLYDHTYLTFKDIVNIDNTYVDIKINYQKF